MRRAQAPNGARVRGRRRSRVWAFSAAMLSAVVLLVGCASSPAATNIPVGKAAESGASQSSQPFDPSVGAPLPYYRIVAAYGYQGTGNPGNGPASSIAMLSNYLPQLQQLGQQYAAIDPTHPVKLAVDLVVQTFAPCSVQYCAGWLEDGVLANNPQDSLANYIAFCQKHNLLLFFDLQFGTEPVQQTMTTPISASDGPATVLTYLEKYPFIEIELDTEFHFPNTSQGSALAAQYAPGAMPASELNWAINELAHISLQYHLPRKVLVTDQWYPGVFNVLDVPWSSDASSQKKDIKPNPNVSLVLQSDGFGNYDNKIGDYQAFVQQDLLEYGGYKLFYHYCDPSPPCSWDIDNNGIKQVQTPEQVMQLFPQPLYISYQ